MKDKISQIKKTLTEIQEDKGIETDDDIGDLDELENDEIKKMLIDNNIIHVKENRKEKMIVPREIECEDSIYLFNREGTFRKTCYYIQQHQYFDRFIMILIALSSIQLAFETYIDAADTNNPINIGNKILGEIFTYLFVLECLFKVVALGFVMDDGSYLRESWNQLDFFIVATTLLDNILGSQEVDALMIMRMLRILRPLRVVSHNAELKNIVIALLDAGGSIFNVTIVVLVVWLMFAIFAVNTYKGHFFYCSIEKYDYSDKYECIAKGGEWLRYDSNFDDIKEAMMSLFIISSLEGWPDIMHQSMDITRVDYGPAY